MFQMPEKGVIPVSVPLVPRHKSCLSKSLPTLVIALFCLMLLVWSIDSCTLRNRIRLRQNRRGHLDLGLHFAVPATSPPELLADTHFNASLPQNTLSPLRNSTHEFVRDGGGDVDVDGEVPVYGNTTKSSSRVVLDWISVPLEVDYTSTLLARWLSPKGTTCLDAKTTNITIPGLDGRNRIELSTGDIHEFVIHAYAADGTRRCSGGDYFETDVSGERWKSRPPVKDLGNGSYVFTIQVHPDFSGEYTLTVVLLFRSFEGLKISTERLAYMKELRNIPIKLSTSAAQLPEIRLCGEGDSDFRPEIWSGRWTRHGRNDKCEIDYDGRYRCLAADYPCESPWCKGPLGSLESNGWVYSAHCSFKIFSGEEAWKCLKNRWIFFWGDSNHVDTIRNILNFILYHPQIKAVPRRFDMKFTNPRDSSQTVRITSIFNGHWNETMNYQGLNSLADPGYRELLKKYFSEDTVPDVMIMNSGLHDGIHWRSIRAYAQGADEAVKFWEEVLNSVRERGKVAPKFIYRTTVATGGYARALAFNPNKIEAFNLVLLDKLRKKGMLDGVIDEFDMTFPWHFDNRCNDGVHYGRGPAKLPWKDGVIGHQYFVDLMLAHVLFNAICPL